MNTEGRQAAVVSSALWAAAGDALGWITELGREETVRHRTGGVRVTETVKWRRRIGGRYGPTVDLPAGTYSDDTQLRLAVGRGIGSTGDFDVEAFSKVELPVWQSYSLGAGRGTSLAASNLAKASVTWFSNFFGGPRYLATGGNGAAMRIQPHVWSSLNGQALPLETAVMRDAIITHGHPQGFLGALFHALCLEFSINQGEVPSPSVWNEILDRIEASPSLIRSDEKLGLFWVRSWEQQSNRSLENAIVGEISGLRSLLRRAQPYVEGRSLSTYGDVLQVFGALEEERRGAGLVTAVAAAALAWMARYSTTEEAMVIGANAIGSDTDTICTMAGALLGAANPVEPTWTIQDREYIVSEARRLATLGQTPGVGFSYPDLIGWKPPSTQSDAVGEYRGETYLAGLGHVSPIGDGWRTGEAIWQWYGLPFGQTVLAKRRYQLPELTTADLPAGRMESKSERRQGAAKQVELFHLYGEESRSKPQQVSLEGLGVDELTDWVIESGFDPETIGRAFLQSAERPGSLERSIAFASILAKALAARRRRKGR